MDIRTIASSADMPAFATWLTESHGRVALYTQTTGTDVYATGFLVGVVCIAASDGTGWVVDGRAGPLRDMVIRTAFGAGKFVWAHNASYAARALHTVGAPRLTSLRCTRVAARTLKGKAQSHSLQNLRPTSPHAEDALKSRWETVRGAPIRPSEGQAWLPDAVRGLTVTDPALIAFVAESTVECARLADDLAADPARKHALLDVQIDQIWRWTSVQGLRVDRDALRALSDQLTATIDTTNARYGFRLDTNSSTRTVWLTGALGVTLPIDHKTQRETTSHKHWSRARVPPASQDAWADFEAVSNASAIRLKLGEIDRDSARSGRCRPIISPNTAVTGRMSVSHPAIQNLTESARNLFLPDVGKVLVGADLAHVEPSILAAVAGDQALKGAVHRDIYQAIVGAIWGHGAALQTGMTEVDRAANPKRRKIAKTVLLGLMYGMGNASLAVSLKLPLDEAVELRTKVLDTWPGISRWRKDAVADARNGTLTTLFGRPLTIDPLYAYKGCSYQIQGSAADIFKQMTVAVAARLPAGARLWLPVHDELVVECNLEQADECKEILRECMTQDVADGVSISADPAGPWTVWQKAE